MSPSRPARAATRAGRSEPPQGSDAQEIEGELRARLLHPPRDSARPWVVWLVTAAVTALAAVLRLVALGRPSRLVFDETYYVKQAYSLLHLGYEGHWAPSSDADFAAGVFSGLSPTADYVVHPAVGKWMIAAGMAFFDPADPVGWRIGAAVTGILSVTLLVLIGRYLFGHIAYGALAGVFLAVDGVHLVMSRIALLDVFLSFWALAGFAALLLDRASFRENLARQAAVHLAAHGRYLDGWGPKSGVRWWLLVAGVCTGLATGVKWSGVYFLAVYGLVAVAWSLTARRAAGIPMWARAGVLRDGLPAFFTLVPTAAVTYLATWLPWFARPGAYLRDSGAHPLVALWRYHVEMWQFHTSLTSEHTYMSTPLGWLMQIRPTSFAWQQVRGKGAQRLCGDDACASAILAVGNPVIWWGGALALVVVVWGARRDWRAWAILAGYFGGYAPWFLYPDRTIFTFYTVAFVPFVALALTYAIASVARRRRRRGVGLGVAVVASAVFFGAYFWPVWTAKWVPYWYWQAHMFFDTWI